MADDLKSIPTSHGEEHEQATFSSFVESTPEDWAIIARAAAGFNKGNADRILSHLKLLEGDCGGFPVTRMEHSLQTATMAYKAGKDEEYVVCALLHDIGDTLGAFNHPDIAAAILKPFVSEENHWMVEMHGIFQGYYFFHHLGLDREAREAHRGHPHFEYTAQFCHLFDQPAFRKDYDTMPLEAFEPMVQRVLAKPKRSIYKRKDDTMVA
jgi:predicted HD phosphohydrolase